jgi:hypothetical protein
MRTQRHGECSRGSQTKGSEPRHLGCHDWGRLVKKKGSRFGVVVPHFTFIQAPNCPTGAHRRRSQPLRLRRFGLPERFPLESLQRRTVLFVKSLKSSEPNQNLRDRLVHFRQIFSPFSSPLAGVICFRKPYRYGFTRACHARTVLLTYTKKAFLAISGLGRSGIPGGFCFRIQHRTNQPACEKSPRSGAGSQSYQSGTQQF